MALPRSIRVTPVINTAAYTAGDAVGARFSISLPFENLSGKGELKMLTILDKGNQKAALNLFLFRNSFTAAANNAAFAVSDDDFATKFIGHLPIPAADYLSIGTAQAVQTIRNINMPITFPRNQGTLYGQLMTTGTPTYTSVADLVLIFTFQAAQAA